MNIIVDQPVILMLTVPTFFEKVKFGGMRSLKVEVSGRFLGHQKIVGGINTIVDHPVNLELRQSRENLFVTKKNEQCNPKELSLPLLFPQDLS